MSIECKSEEIKEAAEESKEQSWRDLPIAGLIIDAGSAERYKTGDWRTERPVWDADKCTSCLLCWIYCPDSAIILNEEGKMIGLDLEHCKGCGICAEECPPKIKAFVMLPESEFREK